MGISIYDSSAAFRFEVPESNAPLAPQELQIGGTSRKLVTPMSNPELLVVL